MNDRGRISRRLVLKQRHLVWLGAALIMIFAAGCGAAATPAAPTAVQIVEEQLSATSVPSLTATVEPLVTASPTPEPSVTPTLEPTITLTSTSMPFPALAVAEKGFSLWCNPMDYALRYQPGPEVPGPARTMKDVNGQLEVYVPAEFCTLVYKFNQPAPEGLEIRMYDANAKPFLTAKATIADGQPETVFVAVNHPYVVNPPFWSVIYRIELVAPDGQVLETDSVSFAKPLPEPCTFGGLPDPVTLFCPTTDPWEVEPHPGVHYPYPTLTPSN